MLAHSSVVCVIQHTTERELRDIFSKYGTLVERPVIKPKMAFITYADPKAAARAINCEQVC